MRYQQTPLARLSKAAKFLESDGAWHPFVGEEGVWYRVRGKLVQRVRLESGETDDLLRLFERFEPLPSKALREGFREELRFIIADDHYLLAGMLMRAYVGWDKLASAGEPLGVHLEYLGGNSLRCDIRIREWTAADIIRSLILSKSVSKVAVLLAQDSREGIPHTTPEITGLLHSAFELFMEEVGGLPRAESIPDPREPEQGSLFG